MKNKEFTLILTSKGFESKEGTEIIKKALTKIETEGFANNVSKDLFDNDKSNPTSIFLVTISEYGADERMYEACKSIGFKNIYMSKDYEDIMRNGNDDKKNMPHVDAIFISQGNTFEVMEYIRKYNFDEYIKEEIFRGTIYIGASAGAILSGRDFELAEEFDRNFPRINNYTALGLLPETDTIIPHYTYEENKRFVEGLSDEVKMRYTKIYNVANDEALIMRCNKTDDRIELVSRKRIRI